jgi:hypothetical protein
VLLGSRGTPQCAAHSLGRGVGEHRAIWWAIRELQREVAFLLSEAGARPAPTPAVTGGFAREGNPPPRPATGAVGRPAARQGPQPEGTLRSDVALTPAGAPAVESPGF